MAKKQTKKPDELWMTAQDFGDTGGLGRKPGVSHPREQLVNQVDLDEEIRD
jgi:hypothetical protein